MRVRERYPEAIATEEESGMWAIWDKPSEDTRVIPVGHVIYIPILLGLGETETDAWMNAYQKIKRR